MRIRANLHLEDANVLEDSTEPQLQAQDDLLGYGFADWNAEGDLPGAMLQGYSDDYNISANSIKWIRTKGAELNHEQNQSFFLAVNFINPHDVMYFNTDSDGQKVQEKEENRMKINKAPDNALYEKTYDVPLPKDWNEPLDATGRVQAHEQFVENWSDIAGNIPSDEARWKQFNNYYYNCIQDSDNSMLQLLQELEALDMINNTIIVYTSDHGEMQGNHGLWGKGGFMYENNIHVPLIIAHPEYEGGKTIDAVTSHVDLAPTVIDMTGISGEEKARLSTNLRGKSMMPLLDGSTDKIREGALFVFDMISMVDYKRIDAVYKKNIAPTGELQTTCKQTAFC